MKKNKNKWVVLPLLFVMFFAGLFATGCTTSTVVGEKKPDSGKIVRSRVSAGLEYLQYGKPQEARRHLSRALEEDPKSAEAHNAMALLYKYEGDEENEEYHFKRALRYDAAYSPARNNYGTFLYVKGDYERALKQFKRAAEDPGYDGRGIAFENMARCYLALGELGDAKNAFLKSVRLNPESVTPHLELGWIYFREDRVELAYNYYQEYARRVANQSARGLLLGVRLEAQKGNVDAQASYEMALKQRFPDSREYRALQEWKKRD